LFFGNFKIFRGFNGSKFVSDFNLQLPDSFDTNRFAMVFMAVNGKQQIGNEACQDLNHQAIAPSCYQMVNTQMAFPPGKEIEPE
jgi:hypothetical protein